METVSAIDSTDLSVIVVDNTGIKAWEISPYYNLARAYGHEVRIIHLECDCDTAHRRNIHGVPLERVEQMGERLAREELPASWNIEFLSGCGSPGLS